MAGLVEFRYVGFIKKANLSIEKQTENVLKHICFAEFLCSKQIAKLI